MPMQPYQKKRRVPHGPSKNELRAARGERDEQQRTRTGTLRQRYPRVERVELDLRLETPSGAELEHVSRSIDPNEPLLLDIPCQGGCGGGSFLLTEVVETLLQAGTEHREGLGICQATSYTNPTVPCGTKLYYRIAIQYGGAESPPISKGE